MKTSNNMILIIIALLWHSTIRSQIDLDLHNALKVGNTTTEEAGIIRYNAENQDFEGYDGERWWSLTQSNLLQNTIPDTTSLLPQYADTIISDIVQSDTWFGQAIAIEDSVVVVKNRRLTIYQYQDNQLLRDTIISPPVNSDGINDVLALNNGIICAGYPNSGTTGEVYLTSSINSHWQIDTVLSNPNSDSFGSSVEFNGRFLAIGAKKSSVNNIVDKGKVFIYENLQGLWTLIAEIDNPNTDNDAQFGLEIDIDSNYLIVGSLSKVYVYGIVGNTFSFLSQLDIDPHDVALNSNQIFVGDAGVYLEQDQQGAVYVIDKSNLTITDTISIAEEDLRLGSHLSVNDNLMLVSAESADFFGTETNGSVYVYYYDGNWNLAEILRDPLSNDGDEFGLKTDIDGHNYIIGVPRADINGNNDRGKVIVGSFD